MWEIGLKEAIEDILSVEFTKGEAVYTSKYFLIKGDLRRNDVEKIAKEVFAYESVESWHIVERKTYLEKGIYS